MTTINIENVSKQIKGVPILNEITMQLKSGTTTGFQGINGSGKTMLMRTICGLVKPTGGSIAIDGKVLWKDISFPPSIGVLIENPAFLDGYSGFDNLKMLAQIKNIISDQDISNVITRVGLDPSSKKKYKTYSLGLKQRLGIAAAIMEKPSIVLLDEPTNALDTAGINLIKDILLQEKQRQALIVISCHDKEVLEELSDEIYLIESGSVTDYKKLGDKQ